MRHTGGRDAAWDAPSGSGAVLVPKAHHVSEGTGQTPPTPVLAGFAGRYLGHRSASSLIGSQKGIEHGVSPQLSLYKVTSPYWGNKASEDSAVILWGHTGPMR